MYEIKVATRRNHECDKLADLNSFDYSIKSSYIVFFLLQKSISQMAVKKLLSQTRQ